jgi:predicted TIM-barrel fold metal-dependent hydrolase
MSLTRRAFLRTSGTGLAAVGLTGCSSSPSPGGDGRLEVIDVHTHFYDPTRPQGVPWPGKGETKLYRRVMPGDYRALKMTHPAAGTVVVEASAWVEDNQWVLDLAEKEPFLVGLVGNLKPGLPEFEGHLKRFSANRLFRGLRVRDRGIGEGVEWAALTADLKRMADRDLALDVNVPFKTLADVERAAREVPDLRIVINHVALARIDGKIVSEDWSRQMRALARLPKITMKVSGLVESTGRRDGAPRDVEFYKPWLDVLWDTFGEDRLVYGSNWPVCELFASLETVQGLVTDYFSARGGAALEKVFSRNSRAIYKWIAR